MSTQHLKEQDIEQSGKNSVAGELGVDPRYEITTAIDPNGEGLGAVVDPWINMQYPLNRESEQPAGVIHHSKRWEAVQRPDGSGILKSSKAGAVYGIRTAAGAVIGNTSRNFFWPWKSEYYHEHLDDGDYRTLGDGEMEYLGVPYRFVGFVLSETTEIDMHEEGTMRARGRQEDNWVEGKTWMQGVVAADILKGDEEGVLLTHKNGQQVYIGWDSTSHDGFELFGFVTFDGEDGIPAPSAEDALDLLRPNEAAASEQSKVARQGEWFLIPADEEPEGTIQKPGVATKEWRYTAPGMGEFETRHEAIGEATKDVGPRWIKAVTAGRTYPAGSPLDNHIPRDWKTGVEDDVFVSRFINALDEPSIEQIPETPQDVVDIVEQGLAPEIAFDDIQEMAEGIYVRGTLRHRNNEHEMVKVDEWRRATTHDWEVMTTNGQDFTSE